MVKTKRTKNEVPNDASQDDEEALKLHLQELHEELKKKHNQDSEKLIRLLSPYSWCDNLILRLHATDDTRTELSLIIRYLILRLSTSGS